jgi:hypothetical protein
MSPGDAKFLICVGIALMAIGVGAFFFTGLTFNSVEGLPTWAIALANLSPICVVPHPIGMILFGVGIYFRMRAPS